MKLSSRRSFFKILLSFFFGAACSRGKLEQKSVPLELGALSNFIGKNTELSLYRVVIFSDELGLRALKMVCTHQSCGLKRKEYGFVCPCHGSRFNTKGVVLRGPAVNELKHLKLSLSKDKVKLILWPKEVVEKDWRLSL